MELTPRELDKLILFTAAQVAHRRRERGVKLNRPEAIAVISDAVVEAARDGATVVEAAEIGTRVLCEDDCMPGIRAMVPLIQVEATFTDGTKLVSVHDPISGPADRHSTAKVTQPQSET